MDPRPDPAFAPATPGRARWFSPTQAHLWHTWAATYRAVNGLVETHLQDGVGISSPDYEVLVGLAQMPECAGRSCDLARVLDWERSRLSHHLNRMEAKGLVARERRREGARGALVTLTEEGARALGHAVPAYTELVLSTVFDVLGPREVEILDTALTAVLDRINADSTTSESETA